MSDHRKGRLIQTVVTPQSMRKLEHLARSTGHTKASYLRHLIELHIEAMYPRNATPAQVARLVRNLFGTKDKIAP